MSSTLRSNSSFSVSANNEEGEILMKKLKKAFDSYENACKKLTSAVKSVDESLELIAISVRELNQHGSNIDESNNMLQRSKNLDVMCNKFCASIDEHKNSKAGLGNTSSQTNRGSTSGGNSMTNGARHSINGNTDAPYSLKAFINDFTCSTITPLEHLKSAVKAAEKNKDKRRSVLKDFTTIKTDINKREAELAKKNKDVKTDEKYKQMIAKRDKLRQSLESEEVQFHDAFQKVLVQRATTLEDLINAMKVNCAQYFRSLNTLMQNC